MNHYLKTELGIDALKHRSLDLNARQRRLLVLIGSEDFQILNPTLKEKIATPTLLSELEEKGLIFSSQKPIEQCSYPTQKDVSEILLKESPMIIHESENHSNDLQQKASTEIEELAHVALPMLNFNELKQCMIDLLTQYCGLMAKRLVIQIQNAENIRELKLCQMQWITALQETRIPPLALNQTLHQINLSFQHMQAT